MITIRDELVGDIPVREALLDRAFGKERLRKTAERLRTRRMPAEGLSFIAQRDKSVVGTLRLWHVSAGPSRPALLLGPLAVDDASRGLGIGAALMQCATEAARAIGHAAILLVGDAAYYLRFGFSAEQTGRLWLPGPFERGRLLARELIPGALADADGLIAAAGQPLPKPQTPHLVTEHCRRQPGMPRAA